MSLRFNKAGLKSLSKDLWSSFTDWTRRLHAKSIRSYLTPFMVAYTLSRWSKIGLTAFPLGIHFGKIFLDRKTSEKFGRIDSSTALGYSLCNHTPHWPLFES